jgi:DNA-binding transcriptional LysR family regulator
MMNLRQLECFKVLAEELNFTRAAEKLHMAQPPLSRQVKLLEESLGVILFERTKRMVRLTTEGEYLKSEIGQTFRQLDQVKAHLTQIREGRSGILSVGYVGAAMHSVLPAILKKFSSRYAGVQLRLHEMDNTQQVEALKKGTLDIGFIRSRMNDETIALHPVFEESFSLVVPKTINLRSVKPDGLKALAELPFIGFPMACAPDMVKSIYSILQKLKLTPAHTHESSQINSIMRMAEAGMGYSILPGTVSNAYKVGVKTHSLKNLSERAYLFAGVNKERDLPLVGNMLKMMPA